MISSIRALLAPRSVAVIGASADPLKRGHQAIRRLQADGFPHPIYPVNPGADHILGLPSYPHVEAIDADVDLALLATPAALVPEILAACGRKGVAAAVVIAVGFGETGEQGRELEAEVARVATAHGIALVGPNTNGILNPHQRLNLVGVADVPAGEMALLCQSGNMGLSLIAEATHRGSVGFSAYVGIGNEAGLRYHELLPYLAADETTGVVALYAEGFRDGRAFLASAAELTRSKPVVAYKAGRSPAAQRSALSHTGAVAGSPEVADAVLAQAGVVVVDRSDELLAVGETVLHQPPLVSSRVAVLADGGGHATVATDALGRHGLDLATLADTTRDRLTEILPPAASVANPVDVAGATDRDPSVFAACVDALLADPGVAGVLCVGLFGGYGIRFSDELAEVEERTAARLAAAAGSHGKALLVQSTYADADPPALRALKSARVPVTGSVETAVRCLAALGERGAHLSSVGERSAFVTPARPPMASTRALSEPEGRRLVEAHGIGLGPWAEAGDAAAAAHAARELAVPVAMKIVSAQVVHKSDAGGVLLDVHGEQAARQGFEELTGRVRRAVPDAEIDGVVLAPMAAPGIELLVGATIDPTFGPLLTVGAGGVAVEVTGDLAFRAVPVTRRECEEMLDELVVAPLLAGHRGEAPVDRAALVALLLRVSELLEQRPEIVELDLNPVIARADGVDIVDVRVVVGEAASTGAPDRARGMTDRGERGGGGPSTTEYHPRGEATMTAGG
jgi:acetate---CoA ligase (ADP-forming)